jgi:hypothetical protein
VPWRVTAKHVRHRRRVKLVHHFLFRHKRRIGHTLAALPVKEQDGEGCEEGGAYC